MRTSADTDPLAVIEWILSRPAGAETEISQETLADWLDPFLAAAAPWKDPLDRAVAGGFMADRLAWAFAAGYREALQSLFPELPERETAALCVTETGGNHPRAIRTRLRPAGGGWEISGAKTFVTGADTAKILLVAVTTGTGEDGRPELAMVRLPAESPGVAITPLEDLPFVPEIGHGSLTLENVSVDASGILPGDGYARYVKPFRTLEDIHVRAAVMGYLCRVAARSSWPKAGRTKLMGLLAALRTLSGQDPLAPHVHIVLGGVEKELDVWIQEAEALWAEADPETRTRWHRDATLLGVARGARDRRLATAWQRIRSDAPPRRQ